MTELLRVGDWATLGRDATGVRLAVFVTEQGIDESLECDEHDATAVHAVGYVDGRPVATGRLLADGRIGRMAVLAAHRRSGWGSRVLVRLMAVAAQRGEPAVQLSAQVSAIGFYERHGFAAFGERYDDAGIEHQSMRRTLP
jgi:predicted GNAT family N-acyltransferase